MNQIDSTVYPAWEIAILPIIWVNLVQYLWAMKPNERFEEYLQQSEQHVKKLKSRLTVLSALRLLAFLIACSALYFFWNQGWIALLLFAFSAAAFLFLIRIYADCKELLKREKTFIDLCAEQIESLRGNWKSRPAGESFINANHPYASDLNIFGKHSLFQYMNYSQSVGASGIVAGSLLNPLLSAEAIAAERATVRHFATDPEWSLRYLALARLANVHPEASARIERWSNDHATQHHRFIQMFMTRILPAVGLGATLALAGGYLSWSVYTYILLVPLIFTAVALKKHQAAFAQFSKAVFSAAGVAGMLEMLRTRDFEGSPFQETIKSIQLQQSIIALAELSKIDGAISSRNNLVVGIGLNALLLWDFQCMRRLQNWKARHGKDLATWIETAIQAEALQSPALFCHNHPHFLFPEMNLKGIFEMEEARHPLMNAAAVPNDLALKSENSFYIITGANMAGKSTYLRMVGLSLVMAMRGLPIAAKSMTFQPCQIYTSMLTTDSLGESESYFFSELKRLRQLVDSLEKGGLHFLILDEILKGTNSTDKAEGSKRFMKKLLSLPAKGLIATHDLSLCTLAEEYKESIENMRFEVHYTNNELDFRYEIEPGICENMNASFLIEKMGLSAN